MTRKQIIEYARETIEFNKTCRDKNNKALNEAIRLLEKHDGEYERGAEEAWELAKKLYSSSSGVGFTVTECRDIFGCFPYEVFEKYTVSDALSAYNDWLKEKEEEAAKPKLGDVVEVTLCHDGFKEKGIFLSECFSTIKYLNADGVVEAWSDRFKFVKTGEHVDIQGILDKINE